MFSFLAPVVEQLEPINGCFCCLTINNLFLFGSNAELDYVLEHQVQKNITMFLAGFFSPSALIGGPLLWVVSKPCLHGLV